MTKIFTVKDLKKILKDKDDDIKITVECNDLDYEYSLSDIASVKNEIIIFVDKKSRKKK